MKAEDYHKSLALLEEACRLAGWACLVNPLVGGKAKILLRHFALVSKVWKNRKRRILVREFSTLPLLSVFPFIWPLRRRIVFLINHNLQWAARSLTEQFGLRMLSAMRARWALFETQDFQGLEKFNIPSDRNLVLPHPVPAVFSKVRKNNDKAVIGVAGYYRPEKGMDELVGLLKKHFPRFGILLGVPNPEEAGHLGVETVSTATEEAYREMIARCDVLVFNNAEDGYFYRASGPVADAAACGTAVVAPDFPMLGKQVAGIGETFQCLEKMPRVVELAVEKQRAGKYSFESYCATRSVKVLSACLDRFVNG